jgi:hypothetical protein
MAGALRRSARRRRVIEVEQQRASAAIAILIRFRPERLSQFDHERRPRRAVGRASPAHWDGVRLDRADLAGEGLVANLARPSLRWLPSPPEGVVIGDNYFEVRL